MAIEIPPSGRWKGYYLYGDAGLKHRMDMHLTFSPDGRMDGDGIDDIAPFTISGVFDAETSHARWAKAYIGAHTVAYAGVYCGRSICGEWELGGGTGGFWIWPASLGESEYSGAVVGVEEEVAGPVEMPAERIPTRR
jgi:hypothetical protein